MQLGILAGRHDNLREAILRLREVELSPVVVVEVRDFLVGHRDLGGDLALEQLLDQQLALHASLQVVGSEAALSELQLERLVRRTGSALGDGGVHLRVGGIDIQTSRPRQQHVLRGEFIDDVQFRGERFEVGRCRLRRRIDGTSIGLLDVVAMNLAAVDDRPDIRRDGLRRGGGLLARA